MKRCVEVVPLLGPRLDGALSEDDFAWVDDHLRGCPACRDRQALIAAQAQALRESLAARAARIDLSGFAGRVLARTRAEKRGVDAGRANVWGREMWWAHRGILATGSGLAVAACMALAVLFVQPQPADEVLVADNSPQVEEVDFGTHDGAVLQLPGQTTVIWMSDDRAVQQ
jgi:anti-sigma factor RsiW